MIDSEATTLGAICNLITDGKHGDCENEENSRFFFLSAKDVRNGKLNYEGARQITEADFLDTHRRTQLEPNDLLISNSGTIGRMALVKNQPETRRTTFQKSVAILKPKHDNVCVEWLYYYLHYDLERLVGFAGGTAQKNLLLRDLRAFTLDVPAVQCQRKIASILSAYDDLIENNTRRIAILEEMAQAIYREWFVNFRFPGHENVKLVDSPLGQIPEGWKVATVSDFGKVITGKTPSKKVPENFGDYMPFIKTPSMHGNTFCIEVEEYLSEVGVESQRKKTLPPDTMIVNCIGALAGSVSITVSDSQTNQQINAVVLNSLKAREFLYLTLVGLRDTIRSHGSAGATMINLSKGKFEALPVVLPTPVVLSTFHEMTYSMLDSIRNLQRRNIVLRTTRDLLLPKLISGKLDVEDLDIDAGDVVEKDTSSALTA